MDALIVHPDDAAFDPIAYAAGVEDVDRGVTFYRVVTFGALIMGQEEQTDTFIAWRRSYMEGYLRAMHVLRLKDT